MDDIAAKSSVDFSTVDVHHAYQMSQIKLLPGGIRVAQGDPDTKTIVNDPGTTVWNTLRKKND